MTGRLPWAALALAGCLLLPAAAAHGKTLTAGLFSVVHAPGREKTARFVLREAERSLGELQRDLGGAATRPVTIVILDRAGGGEAGAPSDLPAWFAGAALPAEGTIWLKTSSALKQGPADLPRTLTHELAHIYLRWRTGGRRIPRWLDEGMAMRQAGEYDLGHRFDLTLAAVTGDLMPLAELEHSFPVQEQRARVAYAEGSSFLGYLDRIGGEGSARRLLDGIAAGPNFDEAFSRVYGRKLATAEDEWRRTLTRVSRWLAAIGGGTSIWTFMSLLFILAYWVKRRSARRLLEEMDAEETPGEASVPPEEPPARRLGPGAGDRPARRRLH